MTSKVRRPSIHLHRRTWFTFLALLVALVAALPLLQHGGLLNTRGGGDSPFLLQRLQQLVAALRDGHFPVRWMPDAAYGYGYPFFNYYAPLSIYVAAVFRLLGAPYTTAIQLAQLSAFLLAAWASLELARRWLRDEWAALLASAAYTLAPFHLVNVYVRGDSLAEFWAMALYPLVLFAADHLLASRESLLGAAADDARPTALLFPLALAPTLALALAYAALILSHNISALIFSPFLLLYVLLAIAVRGSWSYRRRALLQAAAALGLGLLLSAWFWLPALVETGLVQTAPVTAGYFHYANHFRGLDLVQSSPLFDWDVAGQSAFRMGLLQALLILGGVAALGWHVSKLRRSWHSSERQHPAGTNRQRQHLARIAFILATLALATFMTTPLSRWLWDFLPLLPYAQFPWRFLSIQALVGALATGALAFLPGRRLWSISGVLFLLAAMLPSLRVDHLALADADVTPLRLAQYEWFTGNIGTTVSAEYLPQAVQPRPYTSAWLLRDARNEVQVLSGAGSAQLVARHAARQNWLVQVNGESARMEFPTLYWPGWQALLDGRPLPLAPAAGSGLIAVELPSGTHVLELVLRRTPVRLAAELLSLVTILLVAVWCASRYLSRHAIGRLRAGGLLLWAILALLLLLALYWRLRPTPDYEQATLTWDFAQMGYLHHAPQGIVFDDGARLLGYDYNQSSIVAGHSLTVTLEWSANSAASAGATLSMVTPAVNRYAAAPQIVSAEKGIRGGRVVYELPIPANAPPGPYVVRLERAGARALTPSGQTRGPLFLKPFHVTIPGAIVRSERSLGVRVDTVVPPPASPATDAAATGLFDCATDGPSPGAILVQLAWLTEKPLASNYLVSLRLNGAAGQRIAQCDMQPGYGFLPSGSWKAGEWIPDWLALPLPLALPPSSPYVLLVTLYDAAGNSVLTRPLGRLDWQDGTLRFSPHEPQFALPPNVQPLDVRFGDAIALRGYRLGRSEGEVSVTLYWQALQRPSQDFVRFVHLLQNADGVPLAQQDGAPENGAYPTAQWSPGEIVADTVTLHPEGAIQGDLRLAVGFYPAQDPNARLPVRDGQGNLLPDGRYFLPR